MIVKSYKSKSDQSKIMFLLSSDNFKQAYKRAIIKYANMRIIKKDKPRPLKLNLKLCRI